MGKQIRIFASVFWLISLSFYPLNVNGQEYSEYEVKSVYILNFTKFIDWPSSELADINKSFTIGIVGDISIQEILPNVLEGKLIKERNWNIVNCKSFEDAIKCQILLISRNIRQTELTQLFEKVSNLPILTIGDNIEGFCQHGGMVNFTERTDKYRFEINKKASDKATLQISSKLLAIAKIVQPEEIKF